MGANPFAGTSGAAGGRQADVDEADGFISTSSTALQFPKVGFTVGGTILDYSFRNDMKEGERRFWLGKTPVKESEATAKGYPRGEGLQELRVLLFDLQVHDESLRGHKWEGLTYDPVTIEDDDLIRTAWVRNAMKTALAKALQDAKASGKGWISKAPGAYVEWTRTKDGPKTPGKQAPHTFTCRWVPAEQNPNRNAAQSPEADAWAAEDESPF